MGKVAHSLGFPGYDTPRGIMTRNREGFRNVELPPRQRKVLREAVRIINTAILYQGPRSAEDEGLRFVLNDLGVFTVVFKEGRTAPDPRGGEASWPPRVDLHFKTFRTWRDCVGRRVPRMSLEMQEAIQQQGSEE